MFASLVSATWQWQLSCPSRDKTHVRFVTVLVSASLVTGLVTCNPCYVFHITVEFRILEVLRQTDLLEIEHICLFIVTTRFGPHRDRSLRHMFASLVSATWQWQLSCPSRDKTHVRFVTVLVSASLVTGLVTCNPCYVFHITVEFRILEVLRQTDLLEIEHICLFIVITS